MAPICVVYDKGLGKTGPGLMGWDGGTGGCVVNEVREAPGPEEISDGLVFIGGDTIADDALLPLVGRDCVGSCWG